LAISAIGFFVGVRTAVLLLFFLLLSALITYSVVGIYNSCSRSKFDTNISQAVTMAQDGVIDFD
jgi:hypothetical protein